MVNSAKFHLLRNPSKRLVYDSGLAETTLQYLLPANEDNTKRPLYQPNWTYPSWRHNIRVTQHIKYTGILWLVCDTNIGANGTPIVGYFYGLENILHMLSKHFFWIISLSVLSYGFPLQCTGFAVSCIIIAPPCMSSFNMPWIILLSIIIWLKVG